MAIEVYNNYPTKLTSSFQTLYTCPAQKSSVIHSLYCSNLSSFTVNPTLQLHSVSQNTDFTLAHLVKIPPNSTLAWDKPVNLRAGDYIEAKCDSPSGSDVDILLCSMELYNNTFEKYINVGSKLGPTADGVFSLLYKCPVSKANAIIHGLQFSNISNNLNASITIQFKTASNEAFIIGQNIRVPPLTVFILDKTITLTANQSIYLKASNISSTSIHAFASILEIEASA